MISDQQVDFIAEELNKAIPRNIGLRDDLLDHMCCLVEIEMHKYNISFEEAYQKAIKQTAPNGFAEIHYETLFLLNYNKIMTMKRFTYIIGFVFALAFTIGLFFKLMHLQFAMILMLLGGSGLAFIFIPLLLVNKFKEKAVGAMSQKMKYILGALSLMLFMLASWMKIGHFMGAHIILALSFLVFGFGFLPFLFFRMYKSSIEKL